MLASLAEDHRQLELVVELFRQMLRIDDRLVRADDGVHVLEEEDPGSDRVGPIDALGLLFMLAVVAGRVEELPWHDRGEQPHLRDLGSIAMRKRLTRHLHALATQLEECAHLRHLYGGDAITGDHANLRRPDAVAEGDQLHEATPQIRAAASA